MLVLAHLHRSVLTQQVHSLGHLAFKWRSSFAKALAKLSPNFREKSPNSFYRMIHIYIINTKYKYLQCNKGLRKGNPFHGPFAQLSYLHIPANLPLMWDQQSYIHFAFTWPHVLILSMKSCGPLSPLSHTILAKHQAFAPSAPIWFSVKSSFFKAEFCRRHSAKAWQEKADRRMSFGSLTSLSSTCVFFLYALFFAYHPHRTPSLCPLSTDFVPLQIQVLQGGVLFKAFGQGLTREIWTLSAALELIKLWVLLENL